MGRGQDLADTVSARKQPGETVTAIRRGRRLGISRGERAAVVVVQVDRPVRHACRVLPKIEEPIRVHVDKLVAANLAGQCLDLQVVLVHLPHAAAVDFHKVGRVGGSNKSCHVDVGLAAVAAGNDCPGGVADPDAKVGRLRGQTGARRHGRANLDGTRERAGRGHLEIVPVGARDGVVERTDRGPVERAQVGRRSPRIVVGRSPARVVVHVRIPDPQLVLGIGPHDSNLVHIARDDPRNRR